MYIPLDPKKTKDIWLKLASSLRHSKVFYNICNNRKNSRGVVEVLSQSKINEAIARLKKSDYVRLGSNRSDIEPVHFAMNFIKYDKANLTELINTNNLSETISREISLMMQFTFYDNPNLRELYIPLLLRDINDPEIEMKIDKKNQKTLLIRRK